MNQTFVGGASGEVMRTGGADGVADLWRGPIARGRYKASGVEAPVDYEVVEDPRSQRAFVIGCTARAPAAPSAEAVTTTTIARAVTARRPGDGRSGVCRNTGTVASDFVCKRTFLGDPVVTQERSLASYTTTHTVESFKQQCTAPRCAADTRTCDNNPQ